MKLIYISLYILLAISLGPATSAIVDQHPLPGNTSPLGKSDIVPPNQPTGEAPLSSVRFERISMADGLSNPNVRDILQDKQGFMWFATGGGLNRYDGYQFKAYYHDSDDPTTIPFDVVRAVCIDQDGTLWVGTSGGLSRFDRDSNAFTHIDQRGQVLTIVEDSAGIIWAGFWHGLYGYDRLTGEIIYTYRRYFGAHEVNSILAVDEDRQGDLWIGRVDGLDRLDSSRSKVTYYNHDPNESDSLSDDGVTAILEDGQGILWIGTSNGGLNRYDPARGNFSHYRHDPDDPTSLSHDNVTAILEDQNGILWIGTAAGLNQFDRDSQRFLRYEHDPDDPSSLSHDTVTSLYEDRTGVLWIGTTNGINKVIGRQSQFAQYHKPIEVVIDRIDSAATSSQLEIMGNEMINAVYEDEDGVLWLATNAGLVKDDPQSDKLVLYRHHPKDATNPNYQVVTEVFEDHEGIFWLGTVSGWLESFDPQAETFRRRYFISAHRTYGALNVPISQIVEDQSGNLWIGTTFSPNINANLVDLGLHRLDKDRENTTWFHNDPDQPNSLTYDSIVALHVDADNRLWVGTLDGLSVLEDVDTSDTTSFTNYRHIRGDPDSLRDDHILFLFEDPDSNNGLWIGTQIGGLNYFDWKSQTFTFYTTEQGLADNTVNCIASERTGRLWLSTAKGLSRFDPIEQSFRFYDKRDGIPTSTFQPGVCVSRQTGEMVFGGLSGLITFQPEQIKDNLIAPPIAVTAFKVFNETVRDNLSDGEIINLPYEKNNISFDFAALDYTSQEKNQYAYMLEGLDEDWVFAGTRRYADYPDLRPGKYVLRVKGTNNDGIWNEEGTSLYITLAHPFWQKWPFRIVVVLSLVGGAIILYWQRVKGIEARRRNLEKQVKERTSELSQTNLILEREISERQRAEEALAQQRAGAAVMSERNRLARELHDSITQSLYAVTLYADATTKLLSRKRVGPATEQLGKLRQSAKDALGEMRLLIYELRPPILDQEGLVGALGDRLSSVEGRAGLKTELVVSGVERLPVGIEDGLYRIAVEALNNILKHAQADKVCLTLTQEEAIISLEIADDGLGFDPVDVHKQGGLGLVGMAERAEQLGGQLEIQSALGDGTKVRVWLRDEGKSGILDC